MKRSRKVLEGHQHPLQLRKVLVPESTDEWIRLQEGNAYSHGEDWFQEQSSSPVQSRRPLPSVQVLTSIIAPPKGLKSSSALFDPQQAPIFQSFYQQIGVQGPAKGSASDETNYDNPIQHDIDNPSLSSLTKGQHRRYLQITSSQQVERRKDHERKELKSLTTLVKAEQAKFRDCLHKFLTEHKDRFRTGFQLQHPAYPFCRWASNHQKEMNQKWIDDLNLPMHFGKCLQILSFPSNYTKLLDVDALDFEVVHETTQEPINMIPLEMPPIGTSFKVPSSTTPNTWLKDDTVAISLARSKGANIVTTAETLETMLQLPRDSHSRWMFYATTTRSSKQEPSITLLDRPIAQPMRPRQCLELGIQEGIINMCQESDNNNDSHSTKYIYTMWTLPATTAAMRRQPIRVLIRSTVRMVNQDGIPILIRPHLEYFPERGIEEASLYEKSLWILDQVLFQHNVQTRMARVDSQTCQIVNLEETSVAHALAAAGSKKKNPMLHWQSVIQIFQSLPSVGLTEYLMCLPGHDTRSATPSASIHAPIRKSEEDDSRRARDSVVNLENIASQAETVLLNPDALLYCSCDWKWTDRERIPYTFPLREKHGKTSKQ